MTFSMTPGGQYAHRKRKIASKMAKLADGGMYAMIQLRSFGDAVKAYRFKHNLSQGELADLAYQKVGVRISRGTIAGWECAKSQPSWAYACMIADTFGIKLDDLRPSPTILDKP